MRIINLNLFSILNNHLRDYPSPKSLGYFGNFGSLLGLALIIQITTGIFLAMYYIPQTELAFLSVEYIMRDVNGGGFLRYLHANTASFYFFFIYLHILRALLYKSYSEQNFKLWISGMVIFLLSMGTAFLGYVLPGGQMSLWGATVITNLITAFPYIGKIILLWVWGGFAINNATLTRFFIIHMVLPFLIIGLVGFHIVLLHEKGSTSPLGFFFTTEKVGFFPYFIYKDLFGYLIFFIILGLFIFFNPNFLVGHPDNYIAANSLVTPLHIVPEWYFLPYYAILRSIPDKLGGVLAMGSALLIFFIITLLDFSILQSTVFRLKFELILLVFFTFFFGLKILGSMPIVEPFYSSGQYFATFYFLFLLTILPLSSKEETLFFKYIKSYNLNIQEKPALNEGLVNTSESFFKRFNLNKKFFKKDNQSKLINGGT